MIKKGYSTVMEKIKELRQKFSNAVTSGTRSGPGRLVLEFYDVMVQIWGGSPSTEPLPLGVESSERSESLPDEENGNSTTESTSDASYPADLSEDGGIATDKVSNRKRPGTSSPVVQFIDNKRKHMGRQLSAAKRDQILIDEAREDNKSRKELADALLQSNQVFAQSMLAVSSSTMPMAQTLTRSSELLSHALMASKPQQSFTFPQPQSLYSQSYMGMTGNAHGTEYEDETTLHSFSMGHKQKGFCFC